MNKIFTLAAASLLLMSCSQKPKTAAEPTEPATITWIEDKPGPSFQDHRIFPNVPDSLWEALGLQDGVPSSISCFLLKADGETILLDAGLGAPFSQTLPKLQELGVNPDSLKLIYITHMHGDHIGGLLKEGEKVFLTPSFGSTAWKLTLGQQWKPTMQIFLRLYLRPTKTTCISLRLATLSLAV